jgi:type IV pilus assembly protein PilM
MLADEAEAVLRGDSADERLRSFLYERSQEVGRGIERATAFLETQEVGASLGRLFLCGGGVRVPGLAEALAERLGVETKIANPIERLGVKAGAIDLEEASSIAPLMMLSVGLALRRVA